MQNEEEVNKSINESESLNSVDHNFGTTQKMVERKKNDLDSFHKVGLVLHHMFWASAVENKRVTINDIYDKHVKYFELASKDHKYTSPFGNLVGLTKDEISYIMPMLREYGMLGRDSEGKYTLSIQ
jgi:hypothetical protein